MSLEKGIETFVDLLIKLAYRLFPKPEEKPIEEKEELPIDRGDLVLGVSRIPHFDLRYRTVYMHVEEVASEKFFEDYKKLYEMLKKQGAKE